MFLSRRRFLSSAAAGLAVACVPSFSSKSFSSETDSLDSEPHFTTSPRKAWLGGICGEEKIEQLLKYGFTGMEVRGAATIDQAVEMKKTADKMNFTIHSVMSGSAERIELAAALGADTILLVPGRVGGMPMPKPWEFVLDFDEKTNRLKSVVEGDNTPYQAYIDAHNKEMESARRLVESLIPIAEKNGVVIALENVWNNMWVQPRFAANFILSFDCPTVRAYVDLGNHVRYANPLEWFKYLGGKIRRIHLKDFKLNPNGQDGSWCRLREGSNDWPALRKAMDRTGFNTWCTIEEEGGIGMTLEYQAQAADLILAGK